MNIEPAHIDMLARTPAGDWQVISAETNTVAADLQTIDKSLKVRLAGITTNEPYFVVYRETWKDGRAQHELVLTHVANRNTFGVWEGLHQGIVDRVREIDKHGNRGYDFAKEVEVKNREAEQAKRARFRETMEPISEMAAYALRKDLGIRYKGRAFKP